MSFIDEVRDAVKIYGGLKVVSDMDGVVAEYKFGEGKHIQSNVAGVYAKKRPIRSIISLLNQVSKMSGVELYIATSYFFDEQMQEKNHWIDINMPFVIAQNRIFHKRQYGVDNIETKLNEIKEQVIGKTSLTFLIDDTHSILFRAIDEFGTSIRAYHVSALVE